MAFFISLDSKTVIWANNFFYTVSTLKQQIFVAACPDFFPEVAFQMAKTLATAYSKDICFLGICFGKNALPDSYESTFKKWTEDPQYAVDGVGVSYKVLTPSDDFTETIEATEASMLVFQLNDKVKPFSKLQSLLDVCRGLRIPYFFVKEGQRISFDRVLVPVGFLMEEREKGPFSNSFVRFFDSEIILMPAKDYGSKARQTTDAIRTLIEKSNAKYQEFAATKDSFKVELEAAQLAPTINASLLMISASRDYGLDDIIFGPKERKVIQQSSIPVMVINPRGDLYALCG